MGHQDEAKPPSHFCALVVMRLSEEGKVECLVIDYQKRDGPIQIKWAGGNSEYGEVPFVDIVKTLRREVAEELGVKLLPSDEVLRGREVFRKEVAANHVRHFFLVTDDEIIGELRTKETDDGDEVISPPYWIEVTVLWGKIFITHKPALLSGLNKVCELSPRAMTRYRGILER